MNKGKNKGKQQSRPMSKAIKAYAPFKIGCAVNPRPRMDVPPLRRLFQFDHDITQNPQSVNCSNILSHEFNTERYTSVMIHSIRCWTEGASNVFQAITLSVVVPSDRPDPASHFTDYAGNLGQNARVGLGIPNNMLSQYKKSETFCRIGTSTCSKVMIEVDATVI